LGDESLAGAWHIESHASLPQRPAEPSEGTLNAIIVPTIHPGSLGPAAKLAAEIGCQLVVLCTTPDQAARALPECRPITEDAFVTYVPESVDVESLAFLTSGHPENDIERSCHIDIARKRNVGLMLARLCGWHTVMYLDDDIRAMTPDAVSRAAGLASQFRAAGFEIGEYPDNSVVCHAYRLAGGRQDVFPGGSALVINVARSDAFFPPIYNEDWLFLFDAVQSRAVAVAGTASQLRYQPFAHPRRAASEEFGDVIAEGLYSLLHDGADLTAATQGYWRDALERRSRFIDEIAAGVLRQNAHAQITGPVLMSLAAARKRLAAITPLACVSFMHAWRADTEVWRERLDRLTAVGDIADAAKFVGLPSPENCVSEKDTRSGADRVPDGLGLQVGLHPVQ
jgi:hypothetical protein